MASSVMIRVPKALKARLDRIAAETLESYENGFTQNVELCEQGNRGVWIPLSHIIERALDELEDHKQRSKASSRRKASGVETTENVNSER